MDVQDPSPSWEQVGDGDGISMMQVGTPVGREAQGTAAQAEGSFLAAGNRLCGVWQGQAKGTWEMDQHRRCSPCSPFRAVVSEFLLCFHC